MHHRHRTSTPLVAALATVCLLVVAAPADAQVIPDLLGGGDSGGTTTTTTSTTTSNAEPPAGGTIVEGESMPDGTVVPTGGAHGGAFLRTLATRTTADLGPGTHELTVRARASRYTRLRITVDGATVGSYTITTSWVWVRAVVHADEPDTVVGLEAEVLPKLDEPRSVDIDWLHVAGHEPVMTTAGNRILDVAGQPTVPRGVTMPGFQAPNPVGGRLELPPSMAAEQFAWGVTLVRLPLNQEHWLANCSSLYNGVGMGYRQAVAEQTAALTSRGMMVLLTLTRTERGKATGCAPAGLPVFKEMADTRSLPFWRSVATTFASDPLVAFDLFNEPHSISDAVWRNGGTVSYKNSSGLLAKTESYQAVGMQRLYKEVRGAGADNLVFVSGQRWASDPRVALNRPLDGYGIVLAAHTYCHSCSSPALDPNLGVYLGEDVRARFPVHITEAGWINSWSSTYNRLVIDWAEARGIGWSIYGWGHPDAQYTLLASWVPASFPAGGGTNTFRPSWAGAPVWNQLEDVRVSRGFDAQPLPEN